MLCVRQDHKPERYESGYNNEIEMSRKARVWCNAKVEIIILCALSTIHESEFFEVCIGQDNHSVI